MRNMARGKQCEMCDLIREIRLEKSKEVRPAPDDDEGREEAGWCQRLCKECREEESNEAKERITWSNE